MAEKKIQARIRQKVDTKANWDKATNFVPLKGEYIYYSDLHKVKVGDGTTKVGSLPFLADSDTHSITGMYIGATNAKANAATTNGNTYLKLYDDNTKRAEFKIVGSGATKVSSDANGNITISSTDTNTHQSVADKNPTLAWGAKSTVATIGSTDIHVTMPANPNTDTHFTTGLYVGKASEKSNSATTNGNTYLKLFDNDTRRAQHLINGGGATTVTSEDNGTITVATPIKTLDTTSGSGLGAGSENIAGSGTVYLHKVAKTGSYNDLINKPTIPTIPTNLMTTNTEQAITGKKLFETDLNFGKWVNPVRQVSDAPAKLNLMSSAQTNAGFFDTVMFAGAGDWLYLGHLKPTFSIKASFKGNGEESDTYSASLGYTRGWLDYLTDWDYQNGWLVRPTKVSATTPAIIQIKFTTMLYTDVLRLILTGHNLNDSSGNYSGFLDDYTIEVCTDYAKDTWTTVVNRTNANDNIGKGLIYALQTGSFTTCYGIRLKITKCHVNGNGFAFIKISSMQLRDYRPGIKFPDCLGAISQGGGDVWGALNTNNNLRTHAVFPEATNSYNLGSPTQQYYGAYAGSFYENGTALSDKYLDKGTASTVVNQVVYNPVEMKKALTAPSLTVSDIKNAAMVSTDANGKLTKSNLPAAFEQISVIDKTIQYNDNIEVTEVYLSCEGMEDHYAWDRLVFSAPGSPAASNIKYYYNYMGQKTELTPTNASALNSSIASSGESIAVAINRNESNPTITYLPNGLVLGGGYYSNKEDGDVFTYYVYDAPQGYMPAIREIAPDTSTFLDKGTSSTVVNQVVYNPIEMKKALTVPSIQTTPIQYSPTDYGSAVSLGYTTINGITKAQIQLACPGLGYTYITQTDNEFAISATTKLSCNNNGGWTIAGSKIITESSLTTQQWKLTSTSGAVTTVNVCVK